MGSTRGDAGGRPWLYHGGKAGLDAGGVLLPSPPPIEDGCPVCEARAEGRSLTVGEFRAWLRTQGVEGARAMDMLVGAPDFAPIDPPSAMQGVYVTSDKGYATFYAARSGGDLYRVEPVGEAIPSEEDHFPTWVCESARVVKVLRRNVRLSDWERRNLMRRWKAADEQAAHV